MASTDQLTLPGFVNLLLLIAVHRANPKYGTPAAPGPPAAPLPGCFEALLKKNILRGAKKEQQAALRNEVKSLHVGDLFSASAKALRTEFDNACRAKERGRSLFGGLIMSRATLISECKERGLVGAKQLTPSGGVTGTATSEVSVELSVADIERAFVSCQDGDGGEEGAETINFDEFLTCIALVGNVKYADVSAMDTSARVGAIVANYLREKDEHQVVSAAIAPPMARFDTSEVIGLPGQSAAEHDKWMSAWRAMDLSHVAGFPIWEEEVFHVLQGTFGDLLSIFTYYAYSGDASAGGAWSSATMQQTELVDLALDCGLATSAFPMTKVTALFEGENKRNGSGDADLELNEFLQLVVVLANARANPTGTEGVPLAEALDGMIRKQLSRSARLSELTHLVAALKADVATAAVLKVHEPALKSFFADASETATNTMSERAFLSQMHAAGLIKGAIVPLPSDTGMAAADIRCDLLWLDVSAAFHACARDASGLFLGDYSLCLALCGMIKYTPVEPMSTVQQVAGFLANLSGRMDESDVVRTCYAATARLSPRVGGHSPTREVDTPMATGAEAPPLPPPPQHMAQAAPPLAPAATPLSVQQAPQQLPPTVAKPKATPLAATGEGKAAKQRPPSPRGARPSPAKGPKGGRAAAPAADRASPSPRGAPPRARGAGR